MDPIALSAISREASASCEIRVQILAVTPRTTKGGKPYLELDFGDGSCTLTHRVWSDSPASAAAAAMQKGDCYAITGAFYLSDFGLECQGAWQSRKLEGEERAAVFAGPAELRAKQQADWDSLIRIVSDLPKGPLQDLSIFFLTEYEDLYRRAAAARGNHHARRGGLVEHVSAMARAGVALCSVYPELRRDLLVAGIIFHDSGKIVENQYEAEGFDMPFSFRAEAYGHIAMGIQIAARLWDRFPKETQIKDRILFDALCHLILSHHGCAEWGSPVDPKLPEALVLHFVDNIDAKLEMHRMAVASGEKVAEGVLSARRGTYLYLPF